MKPRRNKAATKAIRQRLEELREEIRQERISYDEIAELQSLSEYIDAGDLELWAWADAPVDGGEEAYGEHQAYRR